MTRDWPQPDGAPIACPEKLKVLAETEAELRRAMRDAFEDAVLMGADPASVRRIFGSWVEALDSPRR